MYNLLYAKIIRILHEKVSKLLSRKGRKEMKTQKIVKKETESITLFFSVSDFCSHIYYINFTMQTKSYTVLWHPYDTFRDQLRLMIATSQCWHPFSKQVFCKNVMMTFWSKKNCCTSYRKLCHTISRTYYIKTFWVKGTYFRYNDLSFFRICQL